MLHKTAPSEGMAGMRVLRSLDSLRVKRLDKGGHGSSIHSSGSDCQSDTTKELP